MTIDGINDFPEVQKDQIAGYVLTQETRNEIDSYIFTAQSCARAMHEITLELIKLRSAADSFDGQIAEIEMRFESDIAKRKAEFPNAEARKAGVALALAADEEYQAVLESRKLVLRNLATMQADFDFKRRNRVNALAALAAITGVSPAHD